MKKARVLIKEILSGKKPADVLKQEAYFETSIQAEEAVKYLNLAIALQEKAIKMLTEARAFADRAGAPFVSDISTLHRQLDSNWSKFSKWTAWLHERMEAPQVQASYRAMSQVRTWLKQMVR